MMEITIDLLRVLIDHSSFFSVTTTFLILIVEVSESIIRFTSIHIWFLFPMPVPLGAGGFSAFFSISWHQAGFLLRDLIESLDSIKLPILLSVKD